MNTPPNARRAAAALLHAVTDEGRSLDDALTTTQSFTCLTGPDRGFARAIVMAALRRLGGIDLALAQFIARPLEDGAGAARAILRTGAAQILALKTPAHAAVSGAVDLAQAARRARPFAGMINAVLRKLAAAGPELLAAQPPGADLPAWLFARWRAAYGDDAAAAIALALREEPPLDLTARDDPAAVAAATGGTLLPTGAVRLRAPGPIEELLGFADGAFWVQDAAAQLPARLLAAAAGERVVDLCAAPGGKTLQLAAAGAEVTAVEISGDRLGRLRDNLARTRLSATVAAADALLWRPEALADAVLLDAPCTATGTLRRHPDVAWLRRPSDLASLSALQAKLLAAAAEMVRPGGRLVYAVCSLEPEEGLEVVRGLLAQGGWRTDPIEPAEVGGLAEIVTKDGALRTLPCHLADAGGMDGFYAARLIKAGA